MQDGGSKDHLTIYAKKFDTHKFLFNLPNIVRNLKFATYLKFATCENINKKMNCGEIC